MTPDRVNNKNKKLRSEIQELAGVSLVKYQKPDTKLCTLSIMLYFYSNTMMYISLNHFKDDESLKGFKIDTLPEVTKLIQIQAIVQTQNTVTSKSSYLT